MPLFKNMACKGAFVAEGLFCLKLVPFIIWPYKTGLESRWTKVILKGSKADLGKCRVK